MDRFYERVGADPILGPIFNDIAHVHWDTHLPKMYDFWDTVLFRAGTFRGNPLVAHTKLVPLADMSKATFDHWLTLFSETVEELFEGTNAVLILRSAEDMANVIYSKINHVPDPTVARPTTAKPQACSNATTRLVRIPP
ncbi:MAG: group III truncated hemoglobin [Prosthecobacter sp.]|nr:group III truncated hemoglobin [Prosthecobacter sp.]